LNQPSASIAFAVSSGALPVAHHHLRGLDPDLPDLTLFTVTSGVVVDDADLHAGAGHTAAAQTVLVRPVRVMVGRRQVDDATGRLGEAVCLPELALEQLHAPGEHLLADR
jgi:hypothetical protein